MNNNKLKYESQKSLCDRRNILLLINEDMICRYCNKDFGKELSIVVCMINYIKECPICKKEFKE